MRILVYVIATLAVLVSAAVLCINQASGAQEMQASPARTDGPIYDLPEGIGQEIVCGERNREYLLLTTEQGGVFLMPYLDEDGEQEIMPQAQNAKKPPRMERLLLFDEQYEHPSNDEHLHMFAY